MIEEKIDNSIGTLLESYVILMSKLRHIYDKYKIKTLDGCIDRCIELWNKLSSNNSEIIINTVCNVIIFEGNKKIFEPFVKKSLAPMYIEMFNRGFLDPNIEVGRSHQPLYDLLPVDEKFFDINLQIIADRRINWSIYSNGTHVLEGLCYYYKSARDNKNEKLAAYYHDAIMAAIKGSCSLFSNKFFSPYSFEAEPLYFRLFRDSELDDELKNEIRDYLLTDDGFNNQCERLYKDKKDKSEQSNAEIAKINELRAKRKEFIQQLKILRQMREKML